MSADNQDVMRQLAGIILNDVNAATRTLADVQAAVDALRACLHDTAVTLTAVSDTAA